MKKNPDSKTLLALTTAALSLPGYAPKAQAWADPESDAGYRFTFYQEGDIGGAETNGNESERYQVISNQFHLLMPRGDAWDFSADLTFETMSGASPWFIIPGDDGKPIQVMSGATIEDKRFAAVAKARQYRETGKHSFVLGGSTENDYLSLSAGGDIEWEFDSRRTTIATGALYSRDELSPTDARSERFPNRPEGGDKNLVTAFVGLTQVLDSQAVAQWSLSYTFADGFLSDPYKQAYVAGSVIPENRPGTRHQFAISAKLRQYWDKLRGALHLDGRYFRDDWGVQADTVEIAWYQNIGERFKLAPSVRWYEQGRAEFYRPYFTVTRDDGFYSSDYRLSAYGALSYRLSALGYWNKWGFSAAFEYYDSSSSFTLREVDQENPGIVDFAVISASISRKF
jgi:hypothetical protein